MKRPGCACDSCEPRYEVAAGYSLSLVVSRYGSASEAASAYAKSVADGQRALLLVNGDVAWSHGFSVNDASRARLLAAIGDEERNDTLPCPPPVGCAPLGDDAGVANRGAA